MKSISGLAALQVAGGVLVGSDIGILDIEFPPFIDSRRPCERNPVRPAARDLRNESLFGVLRIADAENGAERDGRLGDEFPERHHVLVQLAIRHEGAVAAEIQRHRGARDLLRLVRIAEQELAGRQRSPVAGTIDRAVAVRRILLEIARIFAFEHRIAERIGESEVLLGAGEDLPIGTMRHDRGQLLVGCRRLSRRIVARQDSNPADRLAQRLDLPGLGIELPDRGAVGVHLRVQGDEHVHGIGIDGAGRRSLGPHLIPCLASNRA